MKSLKNLLILFIILVFAALSCFSVSCDDADIKAREGFIVKPYQMHLTKTTITIMWETVRESNSCVEYKEVDKESKYVKDEKLNKMHEIEIKELKPDTKYLYRIISRFH